MSDALADAARLFSFLLGLGLVACSPALPPAAAPTPAPATPEVRAAAPAARHSSPFSEREETLLCGAAPSAPGAMTFVQVRQQLEADEAQLQSEIAGIGKASEAQCKTRADDMDAAFEQLKATSRSYCDQQAARGIGNGEPDLLERSDALVAEIDVQLNEMAAGDAKQCAARASGLAQALIQWRALRALACEPTLAERAVLDCGVEGAADPAKAQQFCAALAKGAPNADGLADELAQCVAQRVQDMPVATRGGAARGALEDADRAVAVGALETRLLRGTADFFAVRAQEEASLFAYELVKDRLCNTSEVEPYLVNTCALFDVDDALAPTPAAIRAAVRADLEAVPSVLIGKLQQTSPHLACGAALSFGFGQAAIEGVDVLELLGTPALLLEHPLVEGKCTAAVLADIEAIMLALRQRLDNNRAGLERMVLSGQFQRAAIGPGTRSPSGDLNAYGKVLERVMVRVRALHQAIRAWEKDPKPATRATVVLAGLQTVEPILVHALEKHAPADPKKQGTQTIRLSIELAGQLVNHEYAAAVVTASRVTTAAGLASGKAQNLLGLAASLAQAESSDDVRATLNDAALPLGSWRRKNEKRFGATLTGVVGLQLARELVIEDAPRTAGASAPAPPSVDAGVSFAPMLLIGIDFHGGVGKGVRLGAQLSLLDLGALLSLRLDEPTVKNDGDELSADDGPELRVEQVFSPGLYPYVGFGPFDVGVGVSFVPALRAVDSNTIDAVLDVVRLGLFMAIDVSVLPLF